jgi:CheY-like chemotaxis protein
MNPDPVELMTPRIMVLDDERQIHAALRLRLGSEYELVSCFGADEALERVSQERFDLCLVDINMPGMDGLSFIESARKVDNELGYVVLSAYDSDSNLRRTIPLQVCDFISKPLPERSNFEGRIPQWIRETRQRRRAHYLATQAHIIASDRDVARLEREVEFVASETARDALLQAATLLTTVQAHIATAASSALARAKSDANMLLLHRNLEGARRAADAAALAAESFFGSAYGSRDSSPGLVNDGVKEAINIALRVSRANDENKAADFHPFDGPQSLQGLSGIGFLSMLVPVIGIALVLAPPNSTVRITAEYSSRLDIVSRNPALRSLMWINRRKALGSHASVIITVTTRAPAMARTQIEAWLKGEYAPLDALTPRGLVLGIQNCQGLLGFSIAPHASHHQVVLVLPV